MMATPGFGSQINQNTFKIRSQTNPEKFVTVLDFEAILADGCMRMEEPQVVRSLP